MRKSEMLSLEKGMQIQHKRNGQVLTVVEVKDNEIVCEERTISVSNCTRWFDVVEISEPVQPVQTTIIEEKHEDDQLHDDSDKTPKTHTTEANTTTNSTEQTNTVQPTIQQDNLIQSLNNLVDLHGCYLQAKKEYIAVKKDGYRGCIAMIRNCRYGNGIHIDMKSKVMAALDENYRGMLIEQYNCSIYDKTRGYYRVFDCSDLDVLETIILTAKKIA